MADKDISQLTPVTSLAGTEPVPVVQGGVTKSATVTQIAALGGGSGGGTGRIITNSYTDAMSNTDNIVVVNNATPGNVAIQMPPSPTPWKIFTVTNGGDGTVNYLTTLLVGAAILFTLQGIGSIDFYHDGTTWRFK